jgi:hypothetical protein
MEQLAALAARRGLPVIFPFREFPLAGGLISYGSSLAYSPLLMIIELDERRPKSLNHRISPPARRKPLNLILRTTE